MRGKGGSARLVRMDQFIYILGLVLCDSIHSTGATGLPRKSSLRRHGDLKYPSERMASLVQLTPVLDTVDSSYSVCCNQEKGV